MFDHLIKQNDLMPLFHKYGLFERDCVFIKEQIGGSGSRWDGQQVSPLKCFENLFGIIPNYLFGVNQAN